MFSCLFCSCSVVVQRAAAAAVTALRGLGLSCSPVSRGGSTNQPTNRPSSNCASCRQISAQHNSTLFELAISIGVSVAISSSFSAFGLDGTATHSAADDE
uniref:Secreted protein n=1 Tax=Globodera rostochiensis TaxID=31243 RepID=A0A914HHV4_GLORO